MRRRLTSVLSCVAFALGCGGASQAEYLTQSDPDFARRQTVDLEGNPGAMSLGRIRFRPEVCEGIDLTPAYRTLRPEALSAHVRAHGGQIELTQARADLYFARVRFPQLEPVQLRVAVLEDAGEAGRDLHEAVLEHGPGAWGVHRSNLAVLAPIGSIEQIVGFASRSRLACWGELVVAGRDDDFVIPGAYREP